MATRKKNISPEVKTKSKAKAIKPSEKYRVIRISAKLFSYIQQHAKPLEDTPDRVLCRKLGIKTQISKEN